MIAAREVAVGGSAFLEAGAALPRRLTYRRTVDGRLCAAEFTYQSATYTDCTTDVSPGGVAGKESAAQSKRCSFDLRCSSQLKLETEKKRGVFSRVMDG